LLKKRNFGGGERERGGGGGCSHPVVRLRSLGRGIIVGKPVKKHKKGDLAKRRGSGENGEGNT